MRDVRHCCIPGQRAEHFDERVCMSVCSRAYLMNHISELREIFCACGSVLLWQRCNTFARISYFVGHVTFPVMVPKEA